MQHQKHSSRKIFRQPRDHSHHCGRSARGRRDNHNRKFSAVLIRNRRIGPGFPIGWNIHRRSRGFPACRGTHYANLRGHFELTSQFVAHAAHIQIDTAGRFGNEINCAQLERSQSARSPFSRFRTHDDDRSGMLRHDHFGGLQAIDVRHIDVHGDYVGPQRFRERHRVAPVAGLPRHFELRIGVYDLLKHLAHKRGVIHHQHSNFLFRALNHFNPAAPAPSALAGPSVSPGQSNFRWLKSTDLPAPAWLRIRKHLLSWRDRDALHLLER